MSITTAQIQAGAPVIGDSVASASPTGTVAKTDLVSAATNTGGIIITSISMAVSCSGYSGGASAAQLKLYVNGSEIMRLDALGASNNPGGADGQGSAMFCNIKIPAGQAVSYSFAGSLGNVFITWKDA